MIQKLFRKKTYQKYEEKMKFLGPYNKMSISTFLISRLIIELILLILLIFIPKYGLLIAITSVIIFHLIYTFLLIDYKIRLRNIKLYDETLTFIGMLKLGLQTTNNLTKAIEQTVEHLGNSLAKEFKSSLQKNQYHNDLNLVFQDVLETIPNQDVRVALIDLKEAEDYNTSIPYIQENLEEKSILAERNHYKVLPILLSIISIIFLTTMLYLIFNLKNIV